MQPAIEQFRINIVRVRNLGELTKTLNAQTTAALDLSDILRAEIVLAVSALDHFVHEIVRLGMLEAYRNERPRTRSFQNFRVSLSSVSHAISDSPNQDWLEQEIRIRHGYRSFQNYDKIAEAMRLVSELNVWSEVSKRIGIDIQQTKDTLGLIVNRRNKIAHEADMDPSYSSISLWPIDEDMVDEAVRFIERIAEAIYLTVSETGGAGN